MAERWDVDHIYRTLLKAEDRTRIDCEVWNHKSHDPKHQRAKVERQVLYGSSNIQNDDRQDAPLQYKRNLRTPQLLKLIRERAHAGRNSTQDQKETSEVKGDRGPTYNDEAWRQWRSQASEPVSDHFSSCEVQCEFQRLRQESFLWTEGNTNHHSNFTPRTFLILHFPKQHGTASFSSVCAPARFVAGFEFSYSSSVSNS